MISLYDKVDFKKKKKKSDLDSSKFSSFENYTPSRRIFFRDSANQKYISKLLEYLSLNYTNILLNSYVFVLIPTNLLSTVKTQKKIL